MRLTLPLQNPIHLGKLKIGRYEVAALVIIALAACLRIRLLALGWPATDSDEATMGLMASHIAYQGGHPVFFYGQGYIGTLEAYLGAVLFHLLGPSLFSLRLGMVLLFALFLLSMYILTSLLYSKGLALVTIVLLSLGSSEILFRQLSAEGGHPETPLFATLLILFTTWLALTCGRASSTRERRWRIALYGLWGFTVGVALWNDLLIMPFILVAGVFLFLFCRSELRKSSILSLVLGLSIVLLPIIIYNFSVPIERSSLSVFGVIVWHGQTSTAPSILEDLAGTLLVSLPYALGGSALCSIPAREVWPLPARSSSQTLSCTAMHGVWGLGFIVLFLLAFFLAVQANGKSWRRSAIEAYSHEERRVAILQFARLTLLAGAGLALLIFVLGPQPSLDPVPAARYLVTLMPAAPAILWPIWNLGKGVNPTTPTGYTAHKTLLANDTKGVIQQGERKGRPYYTRIKRLARPAYSLRSGRGPMGRGTRWKGTAGDHKGPPSRSTPPSPLRIDEHVLKKPIHERPSSLLRTIGQGSIKLAPMGARFSAPLLKFVRYGFVLLVGIPLLIGSINTFSLVPSVQARNQEQQTLVNDLLRLDATRIYADYWTCDLVIFLSQEKIICAVLDEQLHPGFDRYAPYIAIVKRDPHPSYVFPVGSPQAIAFAAQIGGSGQAYQLTVVDDYDVYQPLTIPIGLAAIAVPQGVGKRFVIRSASTNFPKPIASAIARTRRKPSP